MARASSSTLRLAARAKPCAVVARAPRRSALRGDVVEAAGDRFVRTERRGRAVPRTPFDVTRTFERGREGGVYLALLVR